MSESPKKKGAELHCRCPRRRSWHRASRVDARIVATVETARDKFRSPASCALVRSEKRTRTEGPSPQRAAHRTSLTRESRSAPGFLGPERRALSDQARAARAVRSAQRRRSGTHPRQYDFAEVHVL